MERDTEISYVRRERDWLARAQADGRDIPASGSCPCCPPGLGAPANGAPGDVRPQGGGHNGHLHAK